MASRVARAILLGAAVAVAGAAASVLPAVMDLEEAAGLPLLFRLRGAAKPPPGVAVVSVDRKSSSELGLPNDLRKWPRTLHARLTDALVRQGASVIVFDLYFEEPRDPAEDRAMVESFARAGNVVVCERLHAEWVSRPRRGKGGGPDELRVLSEIPSLPAVAGSAALAPFPLPKVPLKVSKAWTFVSTAGGEAPTLPVAAIHRLSRPAWEAFVRAAERAGAGRAPGWARAMDGAAGGNLPAVAAEIRRAFENDALLGDRMRRELDAAAPAAGDPARRIARALVAIYEGPATAYLGFYGPAGTVPTVSCSTVLSYAGGEGRDGGGVDVRGKAVFVGLSESSQMDQKDGFPTVFTDSRGLDLSGVEIAATACANFLSGSPVAPLGLAPHLALVILWGVLSGGLSLFRRPAVSGAILVAATAGYVSIAVFRFSSAGTWYPVVVPVFFQAPAAWSAAMIWTFVTMSRDRTRVRTALAHYLPPDAVERITRAVTGPGAGQRVVHGVCLATDGERYTALAETMDPKELGIFMNRYFEGVFEPVLRHGGTVSNVVADSMLALWVDPSEEGAAARAGNAALAIDRVQNRGGAARGDAVMPTRIGLHAGPIFLGDIGAGDHYEYRPFGDIVNTASRIEALNKPLGTRILASDEVAARLSGIPTRPVGDFLFAGKTRPVRVHEVLGGGGGAADRPHAAEAFARGLEAFRRRDWDEAERSFGEAAGAEGERGPSRFYLGLCARYRENSPGPEWSGTVRVEKS